MAINLASKYEKKIAEKFTKSSFVSGNTSNDYNFDGVRTINVYTPQTVSLNDYVREGKDRFGTVLEMQDSVQSMYLRQDKSFALSIDRGNNEDQMMIKNAGRMMNLQIAEQVVPYMDKYALRQFALNAGTVEGLSSAPAKNSIVEKIFDGAKALDNGLAPDDNRFLYIPSSMYNLLRLSSEFLAVDNLADKALTKGLVGMVADMKVIKVPDVYMPDVYFLITYKGSVIMPNKIKTARILTDVQGIDGAVLEGRNYFDAFVIGAKASGVYAAAASASVAQTPEIQIATNKATVTSTTGSAVIYYTLDGTDPRYSSSAKVYSAPVDLAAKQVIKAYATKDGMFPSAVAENQNA